MVKLFITEDATSIAVASVGTKDCSYYFSLYSEIHKLEETLDTLDALRTHLLYKLGLI